MNKKLRLLISISLLLGITPVFAQVIDKDVPSITRDQVIPDDLIVDGSGCFGTDCVNGESFGFSTIRLKENNLRIEFDDTSTTSSFPSNDWQITINDSANGGANKFSIDDITGGRTPFTIEASAPSHSLYVDDGGRLGLGTSTPVTEIHVKDGDSPTLRLEQDGSSGFTPQTWDLAGNETNFFVRDATNGSRLPLRIRPSAPSNSIFVDTDGDVGLGTSSPDAAFEVERNSNAALEMFRVKSVGNNFSRFIATGESSAIQMRLVGELATNRRILGEDNSAGSRSQLNLGDGFIEFYGQTASPFSRITPGDMMFTVTSSKDLKTNIKNLERPDILDRISKVPVKTYNYKKEVAGEKIANREILGLIAQDFYGVLERGSRKEINGQDVLMSLWMGVQELNKNNKELIELIDRKDEQISE